MLSQPYSVVVGALNWWAGHGSCDLGVSTGVMLVIDTVLLPRSDATGEASQ